MKLYLCGPMTGIEKCNRPAFHEAARRLRAAGHVVTNPADLPDGWTWEQYMLQGKKDLVLCEGLAVMPGVWGSRGARVEIAMALTLEMQIKSVGEWVGKGKGSQESELGEVSSRGAEAQSGGEENVSRRGAEARRFGAWVAAVE